MRVLNKGTLRGTKRFQYGGKAIDTTGFARRSDSVYNAQVQHHPVIIGGKTYDFKGVDRNEDLGHQNEAAMRTLVPSTFENLWYNKGEFSGKGATWGVQGNADRGYAMFPQVVANSSSSQLEYVADPREAINRAKNSHSLVQLGNDKNFASYVAQVGPSKYLGPIENANAKEQWSKGKNILQPNLIAGK